MGFRIGDKVKIRDCEGDPAYNGKIGIVIETGRMAKTGYLCWDYLCGFDDMDNYPFGPREMERTSPKVGERLLLFEL